MRHKTTKPKAVEFPALSDAEVKALREFAYNHGASWKAELSNRWMKASAGPVLHRLRNTHGPEWLVYYVLPR